MDKNHSRTHTIDMLFPMMVFFIFTICSVVVILLATGIYKSTTRASSLNNTSATALAYITEKVHQNDRDGCIDLGIWDNCPALVITHDGKLAGYTTYIYIYDSQLKELLINNQASADATAGSTILRLSDMQLTEVSDNLLQISVTDTEGHRTSTLVGLHGTQGR